jgi:hypothetical protein
VCAERAEEGRAGSEGAAANEEPGSGPDEGSNASDAASSTAYGLRSKVAKLSLDDVVVRAGEGLSGAPGAAGGAGASGLRGSTGSATGSVTCDGVTPALTLYGTSSGARSGDGGLAGSVVTKTPAASGGNGLGGTDGADASRLPLVASDLVSWPAGGSGSTNGMPGYAGAGGDNSAWPDIVAGGGASGGCPGHGGAGGFSGGGSIAILALSGDVTVTRSALKTGGGGSGGDGGVGGAGGAGGAGGLPSGGTYSWPAVCTPMRKIPPTPSNDPSKMNCAYYGGVGGTGGAGGHGGGGAGGWTIGVLTVGTVTSNVDAATTTDLGRPGDGGAGSGGGYAPAGEKHATYKLP